MYDLVYSQINSMNGTICDLFWFKIFTQKNKWPELKSEFNYVKYSETTWSQWSDLFTRSGGITRKTNNRKRSLYRCCSAAIRFFLCKVNYSRWSKNVVFSWILSRRKKQRLYIIIGCLFCFGSSGTNKTINLGLSFEARVIIWIIYSSHAKGFSLEYKKNIEKDFIFCQIDLHKKNILRLSV